MKPLLAIALSCCALSSPNQKPSIRTEPELIAGLERYRNLCSFHFTGKVCFRQIRISYTEEMPTGYDRFGACVYEKGNLRMLIAAEAREWSALRRHLLIAHQAEHCLRNRKHHTDVSLMKSDPWLSEQEVLQYTYEAWLLASFKHKMPYEPLFEQKTLKLKTK